MAGRRNSRKEDTAAEAEYNGAFKAEVMEAVNNAIKGAMDTLTKELNTIYNRKFEELQRRVVSLEEDTLQLNNALKTLQKEFSDYKTAQPAPPVVWPASNASGDQQSKSLLAAVHVELADKQRRRCNVVVAGLKSCAGVSDADLFLKLCEENLPFKPSIHSDKCRRLGKVIAGRVQPLLVALKSEEAVCELLGCASHLRKADDVHISSMVYINADLTPAESLAAWEARNRRREKKARPDMQVTSNEEELNQPAVNHTSLSASATAFVACAGGTASSF
jgi:hypothetical protein